MSLPILREFFNALGITKAPKPLQATPKMWAKRMTDLATYKPERMKDMG